MNTENQPLPGDGGPRRSCVNCAFSMEQPLPPPNIGRNRVCRFAPPSVVLIPTGRGNATLTSVFPTVDETTLCQQHRLLLEIANAPPGGEKMTPHKEPAN